MEPYRRRAHYGRTRVRAVIWLLRNEAIPRMLSNEKSSRWLIYPSAYQKHRFTEPDITWVNNDWRVFYLARRKIYERESHFGIQIFFILFYFFLFRAA